MSLFKSRKFWLGVGDLVISLTLFFVGKYAANSLDDVKFIIAAIQPLFVTVIGGIALEDAALKRSGRSVSE